MGLPGPYVGPGSYAADSAHMAVMTTPVPSSAAQSASVMKELERQYRTFLPAKSYAVIRVDGKGFA